MIVNSITAFAPMHRIASLRAWKRELRGGYLASLRLYFLDRLFPLVVDHSLLLEVLHLQPVSIVHMSDGDQIKIVI